MSRVKKVSLKDLDDEFEDGFKYPIGEGYLIFRQEDQPAWEKLTEEEKEEIARHKLLDTLRNSLEIAYKSLCPPETDVITDTAQMIIEDTIEDVETRDLEAILRVIVTLQQAADFLDQNPDQRPTVEEVREEHERWIRERKASLN